jgi:phosphoserine phosphatase RsbU/P
VQMWRDVARVGLPPAWMGTDREGSTVGRRVQFVAIAWFVGVVILDITLGQVAVIIGLVNISTLLMTSVASPVRTAWFAALALAVVTVSPVWDAAPSNVFTVRVLNTFLIGVIAVGLATVRSAREDQLLRVSAAAEAAQLAVLPTLPSRVHHLALAARYHSAADQAVLGGDVYDYYTDETGRALFLVADVCGKGLGSVQEGARVIRAFRQFAAISPDLCELALRMNAYLLPFLTPEVFITAILVDVTCPERVTVASCGHPPPLLLHGGEFEELLLKPGLPLGLGSPDASTVHPWGPGDRLLLYTDGLTEARDGAGEFLALDRIQEAIAAPGLDQALDGLAQTVQHHVPNGRLTDDVCLLLLENRHAME